MRILVERWGRPSLTPALHGYAQSIHQELDFLDRLVAACYASLDDFRLFTASTMLYFAATITYERERAIGHGFDRLFLCADEAPLQSLLNAALERLNDPSSEQMVRVYEAFVEEGIRPYNDAGLFHPEVPNMYHHTAAPV